MGEILIKPYEISVWEDQLTQIENSSPAEYEFVEKKIAVIGSNTMTGYNKVYNPVFNKKTNGEKTLSFSLKYKYFDPYTGNEDYVNPFAALLVNERKVKLHYDGQWYEFIVKDHTESSDGLEWTYTCTDAFVLELSKQGYNITFDSELDNNQGTARELAEETIQFTDWRLGGADNFRQLIEEPIYEATINGTVQVLDTDKPIDTTNEDVTKRNPRSITYNNQAIYVFYSYIKNKDGQYVQFIIKRNSSDYIIDSNNVITDTNYRILDTLTYDETELAFKLDNTPIIQLTVVDSLPKIETQYQANRLAYKQLTTYDPVMGRTVDVYKVDDREIYKYTDYTYTTSDIVMNYITNGENFNALEDGTLQGWNPYTDQEKDSNTNEQKSVNPLKLITKPQLGTGISLADVSKLSQIEGFLAVRFNGQRKTENDKICNTVYNSGIENNASFLNSISKGEKFVFRWRAGIGELNSLTTTQDLGLIVAKYTQDAPTRFGYYYKHITEDDIIIDFDYTSINTLNNIIKGGILDNNNYVIDDVVQVPSTKYIYEVDDNGTVTNYVWDGLEGRFETLTNNNYLPYNYVIGEAKKSVSNSTLTDVGTKIGIFIYSRTNPGTHQVDTYNHTTDTTITSGKTYYIRTGDGSAQSPYSYTRVNTPTVDDIGTYYELVTTTEINPIYIQDIQLTKYVPDTENENKPIIMGNVPTATSNETNYYYMKPSDGTAAEDVVTYTDLETLADDYGIEPVTSIQPLYNEGSEKILTISASQSNCFNILQTIAETFECWVDLVVDHDTNGYIEKDENGKLKKYVYLREYAGKDNYAGFKYGINLQSIERNINSDEIVTKLIVDMSQSDLVDEGYVSIANAPSNQSGESYILNFDYYYSQGLLDKDAAEADRLNFITGLAEKNAVIKEKERLRRDLENSLTSIGSKRNVYTELIDSAQKMQTESLEEFEELTGKSYEAYTAEHETLEENDQLTEEDTIYDVIGRLYTSSATINNYAGILTNIEQEYQSLKKQLYGAQDYSIEIWVANDINQQRHVFVELNDYLPGITFTLGGNNYQTTVSKKYFDVITAAAEIVFTTTPSGYTITPSSYTINDINPLTICIQHADTVHGIVDEINDLYEDKDSFTKAFNDKYHHYIQEGTWNSTDYIDSELYYLDALQVSNTSAQPSVSYTINVVEISELEGFENYLFDAGDKTYVEDVEFFGWHLDNVGTENDPIFIRRPAREEVIVSEVEWHLDEPDQNVITVQNYKTRFEDLFQRISAAVQTVQYNEATYAKMSSLLDTNGTINQNVLLESLNRLEGKKQNLTSDGSIFIDKENIYIQNLTNSANRVIINNEGISVTADGGNTWKKVIDGYGVNADAVVTGEINTHSVIIGNSSNPSFRWDQSGISAYRQLPPTRATTNQAYDLQTYVRYDQYGLYGIKNNEHFKAQSLQDILDRAHFAVTWDGFFIRNSYTDGRVEITSDNDFQVIQTINNEDHSRIKIGALEFDAYGNPTKYGININQTIYNETTGQYEDIPAFTTGTDGNVTITGTINAKAGIFDGLVQVGTENPYIAIDGENAVIKSSLYSQDGASYGWMINADGDAVFNNITARGAIKTAVFEYAEIQAVGGIFVFRPSSTIRNAVRVGESDDIQLTLEKPYLFKVGDWCKVSNYTDEMNEPHANSILTNNGLTHVYKIKSINSENTRIIVLENAYAALTSENTKVINDITDLIGGSLIDMGDKANGDGQVGNSNYGIGINSSDNVVDLPRRAISLFETIVDETRNPKVSYRYRGILGTLPDMGANEVSAIYPAYMAGKQGIYTDNMYIGDKNQYLAFYKDANGDSQLRLVAKSFEILPDDSDLPIDLGDSVVEQKIQYTLSTSTEENTVEEEWSDTPYEESSGYYLWQRTYVKYAKGRVQYLPNEDGYYMSAGQPGPAGPAGEDAAVLVIDSSDGFVFKNTAISTTLTAHVYSGGTEITTLNDLHSLGLTINWYEGSSSTPVTTDSLTKQYSSYNISDLLTVTAKLEDYTS